MGRGKAKIGLALAAGVVATATWIAAPRVAQATSTFKVLHTFCSKTSCTDGQDPDTNLMIDPAGRVYGATYWGGANTKGVIFELVPHTGRIGFVEKTLWDICQQTNCTDGDHANTLIMDSSGNIFGTTLNGGYPSSSGGIGSGGLVFELVRNPGNGKYTYQVLYKFCSALSCADGSQPDAGMIMDSDGNLYGTTWGGGAYGRGTVFELIRDTAEGTWTEKVLYSFCPDQNACVDGDQPTSELVMDSKGALYGTTWYGGAHGAGTVFRVAPDAAGKTWIQSVVYSFCRHGGTCADGANPDDIIIDANDHLYGTTYDGGLNNCSSTTGCGVVYELVPTKNKWVEKIIYKFCAATNCADGALPHARLLMDNAGSIYGTTIGGPNRAGVVFQLTRDPDTGAFSETVLHEFCSLKNCADGETPEGGLVMDSSGNLFGTTSGGGADNGGTIFEILNQ